MKYILAFTACFIEFVVYALIGAMLGWRSGGGFIPFAILMGIMGATWTTIVKCPLPSRWHLPTRPPRAAETLSDSATQNMSDLPPVESTMSTDEHYEQALDEIEKQNLHRATWARAFAEESGDETRARSLYIKLRVGLLAEEAHAHALREQKAKQVQEIKERKQKLKHLADHLPALLEADEVKNISTCRFHDDFCEMLILRPDMKRCIYEASQFQKEHSLEFDNLLSYDKKRSNVKLCKGLSKPHGFRAAYGISLFEAHRRGIDISDLKPKSAPDTLPKR